jgi:hypothetical protein
MHTKILLAVIGIVAIASGYLVYINKHTEPAQPTATTPVQKDGFDGKNASFVLNGENIILVNGMAEITTTPGSATKTKVTYFGNEATADLDGDGAEDVAYLITSDNGGSGTFYYAIVALKKADGYEHTNPFFIGDRIAPQSTYIPQGTRELHINYAERRDGEPMTTPPSSGAVLLLKVTPGGVLEGLMR